MDHPLLLSICAFLMLLVGFTGGLYRLLYKPGRVLRQLGTPVIADAAMRRAIGDSGEPGASTIVAALKQLGSKMPSSSSDLAVLRAELLRALRE